MTFSMLRGSVARRIFTLTLFISLLAPLFANVATVAASTTPHVVDTNGIVYSVENSRLSAIDGNGNLHWQHDLGYAGHIVAAPALGPNGALYLVTESGTLLSFNRETGQLRARYDIAAGVPFAMAPIVGNDGIVRLVGNSNYTVNMPTVVVVIDLEKDVNTLRSIPGRLLDAPLLDDANLLHLDIDGFAYTIDSTGNIVTNALP